MKLLLKRVIDSQLARGSFLVFIASNTASFGNFLYNLFMGRLLQPEEYGDLGAVFSMMILLSVPLSIMSLAIVKIVAELFGRRKIGMINYFFQSYTIRLFLLGIICAVIIFLFSPIISGFLRLDTNYPILILAVYFLIGPPSTLNRGILQGTLRFFYIAVNGFIDVGLKLIIATILVLLNFGLLGALAGPLASVFVVYLLSYTEIRWILHKNKEKKHEVSPVFNWFSYKTFFPVIVTTLSLTIFFTADVILVKHFFSRETAGGYVALATIGKIIFYAVGPIISVMFPLISNRASQGISYIMPLMGTLVVALTLSVFMVFIYFLFPQILVNMLYGNRFVYISSYLGVFSLFITIYTLNSILTYFLLSVSYYKPLYILFIISLLQSVFICLFHHTLIEIIKVNILVSLLYLSVVSFFVWKKEKVVLEKIFVGNILKRKIYG